jgi:3-hydroxyisobutyrate dehydrogenase-like beta-hydroxyacid dehydrogenase
MMKRIGIIGFGNVGAYYVTKLREAGYPVTVLIRNPRKFEKAIKQGATPMETAIDVTQNSDFIILALPNSDIVEFVMEGEGGVLSVLKAGQMVIDTSTGRLRTAIRLEKLCEEKGAGFIDAPLTWRGPDHTHIQMVGGKEENFKKAEEILKCMSYKYRLFGPAGSGQIVKLINNAFGSSMVAICAETVELTKKYGLDPKLLKEYLMFNIPEGLLNEDYRGCGELEMVYKDLGYMLEIAHESCINIPIISQVHEMMKATKIYGDPIWECTGIHTYYKRLNNDMQTIKRNIE